MVVVSERFEAPALQELFVLIGVGAGATTHISSLATTLGATVMTVGRTSVRAKVEPGKGSRYGGGLLDFIVTCVGKSKEWRAKQGRGLLRV